MRSLFCKLFLSFIFIALLVSVTTVAISYWAQIGPYAELMRRIQHHQNQTLSNLLSVSGLAAARILEQGGEQELITYLQEVEKTGEIQILLVRDDNSSISGRTLPEGGDDLITSVRKSQEPQYNQSDTDITIAIPLPSTNKNDIIIMGTRDRIFWPPAFTGYHGDNTYPGPFPLGLPLMVMLVMAATGCFLLARYLTAPIRDLRRATQQIARGDFSARVNLINRRKDEIADLSHDFNIMAEQTQSLLQSQKRLLRDISHELRSPLTRLNLALELARQHPDNSKSYLTRIGKESERLNELITQLLLLTRLESDVNSVPKRPVLLHRLLPAIIHDADFEGAGEKRRIELLQLDEASVLGSTEMLGRAFENVIRNGLRYTIDGSSVELRVTKNSNLVIIHVRDHGPGVPEEHLEKIFKPFFRVAEARDRDSGGTGIGLAIASQAILSHGGTITAQNAKEGGLVIEMSLPLL